MSYERLTNYSLTDRREPFDKGAMNRSTRTDKRPTTDPLTVRRRARKPSEAFDRMFDEQPAECTTSERRPIDRWTGTP